MIDAGMYVLGAPGRECVITPAMAPAVILQAFGDAGRELGVAWTLTSAVDGDHSLNSWHPLGLALDAEPRTHSQTTKVQFHDSVKRRLGPLFDVVFHAKTGHTHAEYDPKGRRREKPPEGRVTV